MVKRLYGDDKSYLKLNQLDNGYQFVSRKAKSLVEGNELADAVVIIAHDPKGRLLVIKEYKPTLGKHIWTLPAGLIDKDENPFKAAARETFEESGMTLMVNPENFKYHLNTYSSPGLTDEKIVFVEGTVYGELSNNNKEESEDIVPYLMGPDDMLREKFDDPMTPMSVFLYLALN